jgi:uncharacterized protein YkvS
MAEEAVVGDKIIFKEIIIGIVSKVNVNSVLVNITENNSDVNYGGDVTVVNHKNYKIITDKLKD